MEDSRWKLVTIATVAGDGTVDYWTFVTTENPAAELTNRTCDRREKAKLYPEQVPFREWHLIAWCEITEEIAIKFDPHCLDNEVWRKRSSGTDYGASP